MYSKRKAKRRYEKQYGKENKKFWLILSTRDDYFRNEHLKMPSYLNKEYIEFQKGEWDASAVFHEALTMQRLKLAEDPCSEHSKLTGLEADCIDVVERRKRMYGSVTHEAQTLKMKGIMKGETLEECRIRHLKSATYGGGADERISNSFKILSERRLKFDWSSLE